MPERDVFQRGPCMAADDAGEAGKFFAGDRVALVRHGGAALLAGAEVFLGFEHFGALKVAQLDGPAIDAGRDDGEHLLELRVAIALDDLGAELGRLEAEAAADFLLDRGRQMRVGADGAAELADPDPRLNVAEPLLRP